MAERKIIEKAQGQARRRRLRRSPVRPVHVIDDQGRHESPCLNAGTVPKEAARAVVAAGLI